MDGMYGQPHSLNYVMPVKSDLALLSFTTNEEEFESQLIWQKPQSFLDFSFIVYYLNTKQHILKLK